MAKERTVVCNSGPLIALGGIQQLDLLQQLFRVVVVPAAVMAEVTEAGAGRLGSMEVSTLSWVRQVQVDPPADALLQKELGAGEAEVITLALRLSADWVLLDERRARRIAEVAYGLSVRGSAGILVMARRAGFISAVRPHLMTMRTNGYYLSDRLIDRACREVGE